MGKPPKPAPWRQDVTGRLMRLDAKLDELVALVKGAAAKGDLNMATVREAVEALKAEVTPLTSAVDAVGALLDKQTQIIADLVAQGATAEEILAATNEIKAQKDEIVEATLRNTPAEPPA